MKIIPSWRWLVGFSFSIVLAALAQTSSNAPRERLLMDFGWKFHLGNEWGIAQNLGKAGTGSGPASSSFSDASWRSVNLPHDWAIELPFDSSADGSHGFKAIGRGFPQNSVSWYRRKFELPKEDAGKRLWLEFDGVFRDCTVFVNGWFIGHHESGYSSFRYDITEVANVGGKNVVSVKVDALEFEGWFYEGAGIYRHVWLEKTAPLAIVPDGIFVASQFSNNVPGEDVKIFVLTQLSHIPTSRAESNSKFVQATVSQEILSPEGKSLGHVDQQAAVWPREIAEDKSVLSFSKPELWSPESPKLYKLITTVKADGKIVDRKETEFGIRTVAFDVEKGFLLNGKPYVLKGTCNHQDHAGVGAALPDRLQYFRIARLKDMGCNAYRTSHNPPTPELLEACDRLGMLVMDENRLLGSGPKQLDEMRRLVLRDRNHPSVVIWSIANEEFSVQETAAGGRVAAAMQALVKQLDPTRSVTYAANMGNDSGGIDSVIEVRGWNYHIGKENMDAYHAAHPNQPNVGTEQGSTVSTRGIYANDKERGYVSAYDDNKTDWSNLAEEWWPFFAERPWLSGGFIWTGFDYRGEPTPYGWPCINSHFGILDTCGFPKDNFYYYKSWWTDEQVIRVLPHWNWPGREGEEIDVRVLSNCEEIELSLNGKSLGRQTMKKNSHLRWKVKYEPGELIAIGFKGGKAVGRTKVITTSEPAKIVLRPDRPIINADGEDISIITVGAMDANDRVVQVATNLVQFELEGPGKILGVGNGDPSCHEPDVYISQQPVRSVPVDGWRWQKISNAYASNLAETAAQFDDSKWSKHDIQSMGGPLGEREHGVFRTKFTFSEQDLSADAVELKVGMIDEDGWAYVNGQRVGESHDWRASAAFDVKKYLHAGENTVAIVVANYNSGGGVNKGASLQFVEKAAPVQWKRSVFNGLAQIIVQGTKQPGEIKLIARSGDLPASTISINSQVCTPRPFVP